MRWTGDPAGGWDGEPEPGRVPDYVAQAPVEVLAGKDRLVIEVPGVCTHEAREVIPLEEAAEGRVPLVGHWVQGRREEVLGAVVLDLGAVGFVTVAGISERCRSSSAPNRLRDRSK